MLTNLQQQVNSYKKEASFTEIFGNETALAVPAINEENLNQLQENKNLPGVYEQLPHHCIQLCLLS